MFEAVRTLANVKKQSSITVHDDNGCTIESDTVKAERVRLWFQEHFSGRDVMLPAFEGEPRPLETPITPLEVQSAAKRLKNGRACGPDNIPNELIKYATPSFYQNYANILNSCFEKNIHLERIGEGHITPLQKPNKPKGPLKNLRPLTLSNCSRKLLSLITLNRIQDQVDSFTGPWQSAYKRARSCTDSVWAQRILISVVCEKRWEYSKVGIDMTAAFDTINRVTILNLLREAGCSVDDTRLVRFLLANTKLKVKINNHVSAEFVSTQGSFQGDSLSGTLFTLTLAGALYEIRVKANVTISRPLLPIHPNTLMPLESEYADDVDFYDTDDQTLENLLPIADKVLKSWHLYMNDDKTERVHFYLAKRGDVSEHGTPLVENEPWRSSKLLGSLLCTVKDIERRIILGYAAFSTFNNIWQRSKNISLSRRLKVYEAQVISVFLYNCGCWAAPKNIITKIDIAHRRHLKYILNIKWPKTISNEKLYKLTNSEPLSNRINRARWRLFGHILRSDECTPASLALFFAAESMNRMKGRLGRHRINLFMLLKNDLKERKIYNDLNSVNDIHVLRELASNKKKWGELEHIL